MSVYVFVNNVNKLNWIFCKIIYHDRKQEKKDGEKLILDKT